MLAGPMLAAWLLSLSPQADIAVFVLDDVAAADLALHGGTVAAPHLEALAARGVTFTRAYANPSCAPSRRALLTGHWWVTGNGEECGPAQPNTPTLAEELLPEALPHTSGLLGKWHLGGHPAGGPLELAPIAHGFDHWAAGSPSNVNACGGSSFTSWWRVNATPRGFRSGILTAYEPVAVRDAFVGGWHLTPSPRLAVVCNNLAHQPFHVPPARYLPPGYVVAGSTRGRFEAMVVASDTILGQMLAAIDLASTLVIVVGDNGTPPPAVPVTLRDKAKGTTFERGVRVPLVIAGGPTVGAGRVVDDLVHIVDLWATCIEAGGGAAPGGSPHPIVSRSLVPILGDLPHAPPHEFVLLGNGWGSRGGDVASVSRSGLKLRRLDLDGDQVVDREEFYDLNTDPGEVRNLIGAASYQTDIALHRAFVEASLP